MSTMNSPAPVRLMLVDDHPLVRDGLRARLEAVPGFSVVAEAGDAQAALTEARRAAPDLVLMDIGMRGGNGIEATRRLLAELPALRVLVLSMHDHAEYVREAMQAGARGYLLKDQPAEEVVAVDHDRNGLADFLVLNGRGSLRAGPIQLIAFFPAGTARTGRKSGR